MTSYPGQTYSGCQDLQAAEILVGRGAGYGVSHLRVVSEVGLLELLLQLHTRLIATSTGQPTDPSTAHLVARDLRKEISELIALGAAYVNDRREQSPGRRLLIGDLVRVHLQPRRFQKPVHLKDRILKKMDDYLIVDKPPGLPVHALVDNAKESLLYFLEEELQEKLFVTHRLDIETSGQLLIARHAAAQAEINHAIRQRKIKRIYQAWTQRPVEPGLYTHYMEPSPTAPKRVSLSAQPDWLACELVVRASQCVTDLPPRWCLHDRLSGMHCLEIELKTGRTQQIRAQLAALGAPILGDQKYGSKMELVDVESSLACIGLYAFKIEIPG